MFAAPQLYVPSAKPVVAASYETEASTLFAAMGTQPDTTRKGHINTCIASLKSAGVWSKLVWLHVYACHAGTTADALLNWKNPGTYNGSAVSSPTFTTDRGVAGNGSSSYINTGYNPNTASLGQNDAHQGIFIRTGATEDTTDIGAYAGGGGDCFIQCEYTANYVVASNSAPDTALASVGTTGYFSWARNNGSTFDRYHNGSNTDSPTRSSGTPLNETIMVCALGFGGGGAIQFSTRQYLAAHMGTYLDATEMMAMYNALNTFKTAIGA